MQSNIKIIPTKRGRAKHQRHIKTIVVFIWITISTLLSVVLAIDGQRSKAMSRQLSEALLEYSIKSGVVKMLVRSMPPTISVEKKVLMAVQVIHYCGMFLMPDEVFTVASIINQESDWTTNAKGADDEIGLMQLLPKTAKNIAKQLGVSSYDLTDPNTNIYFGVYFYRQCLSITGDRYRALLMYNSGNTTDTTNQYPSIVIRKLNKLKLEDSNNGGKTKNTGGNGGYSKPKKVNPAIKEGAVR